LPFIGLKNEMRDFTGSKLTTNVQIIIGCGKSGLRYRGRTVLLIQFNYLIMMKIILPFLLLFFISDLSSAQIEKPIVIGHSVEIQSDALNESRHINIYLPEDYAANDSVRYPVIYIIDGGMEEDFFHITGIIRYNTQPWINRFPRSIVVGVENTDRKRDCSFMVDNLDFLDKVGFKKESFTSYGGSGKYIAFLEKELQPFIDKQYRTNNYKTIIGESFAGLLTTEILLKHRQLFNTYVIITPSLWWGNEWLLQEAPALLQATGKNKVNVYVGACSKDEDTMMYNDAVALKDVLLKYGGKETNVYYDYMSDELHSTVIHQAVYNAFKLIYPHTEYQK